MFNLNDLFKGVSFSPSIFCKGELLEVEMIIGIEEGNCKLRILFNKLNKCDGT